MDLLGELRSRKLLAIVRADGAETALACVQTLVEAGVTALEVSLTTPGGVEAIARARSQYDPDILIGAGTVVTAAQADEVAAARADFTVTPAITRGAHRSVELGEVAGALAVGVGSPLLGDAGTGGSLSELAIRAARFRTELNI